MTFSITPDVHVGRTPKGTPYLLHHPGKPFTIPDGTGGRITPRALADRYLRETAPIFDIDTAALTALAVQPPRDLMRAQSWNERGLLLYFAEEKNVGGARTITYVQTYAGLPIWEAGVSVSVLERPLRITASKSSFRRDPDIEMPGTGSQFLPGKITPAGLVRALGIDEQEAGGQRLPEIASMRLLIYRFDPEQRSVPVPSEEERKRQMEAFATSPPTLVLPPVTGAVRAGRHYVVTEVLFSLGIDSDPHLNWRAFLDVESGNVLYLRAAAADAWGSVFLLDPVSASGDDTITPASPDTDLDPLRDRVRLERLDVPASGDPQALEGRFVRMVDNHAPNVPSPAVMPPGDFDFSAVTDDFAAVNAYHHLDQLFQMTEDLGFDMASFWDGTAFPVEVDHRANVWTGCGDGDCRNARCVSNASHDGCAGFLFALAQAGTPVGMACVRRVVIHEFGHALLFDNLRSANFGFAHSPGDSLAAILLDPTSQAPDRFETFPFINGTRRHDRPVATWAWGSALDIADAPPASPQYNREQILSTTLFRIYRAMGGDWTLADQDRQRLFREFAARYLTYLIIKAIGLLPSSTIIPAGTPDEYAAMMMTADLATFDFEGHRGGSFHKVVRWGFEQQGLYHDPADFGANTDVGLPPPVDVYINDGRNGEYEFRRIFWENEDIWNRHTPDGQLEHQQPIQGVSNYVYVRVKNRGGQEARNVLVSGFHTRPSAGTVWPDDWQPMETAELWCDEAIGPGGEALAGPFEWVPNNLNHECILMSVTAEGDRSNLDPVAALPVATGPVIDAMLTPFDNNIGQRNVHPVPGGGGGDAFADAFESISFWTNNPFEKRSATIVLEAELPEFLSKRGWGVRLVDPGGTATARISTAKACLFGRVFGWQAPRKVPPKRSARTFIPTRKFTLGPRASREVAIRLVPGENFTAQDVPDAAMIRVFASLDDQVVSGMSYKIDPKIRFARA